MKSVELDPISLSSPSVRPEDVDELTWAIIEEGVSRAQANGIACDPYSILSLKEYETKDYICTLEDESLPRPNQCASEAGALGMLQFIPETFERNAKRYGVTGSLWDPVTSVEVACYFVHDEVNISLSQSKEEYIGEFTYIGFIWNADEDRERVGAVYDRAIALRESAVGSIVQKNLTPPLEYESALLWPGPSDAMITAEWGETMWYGSNHNGIDFTRPESQPFEVVAVSDGRAKYWIGDDCDAGVISLVTLEGESFQYVHMETDPSKILLPTTGVWVPVVRGEKLGWTLDATTSCSKNTHLHLMKSDGSEISSVRFKK